MGKTKEEYLSQIKKHFPGLHYSNAKFIQKGWDNDVIVLDNKTVFRFPKKENYSEQFKTEVRFLDFIADKSPVTVPRYVYRSENLSFGGYEFIPGIEMTPSVFNNLHTEQRDNIAKQLG